MPGYGLLPYGGGGGGEQTQPLTYQRRGSLQLWQFLVLLLQDQGCKHYITWTGRDLEFKLLDPEEVKRGRGKIMHTSSPIEN